MREQLVEHKDRIYDGVNGCLYVTVHETANEKPGAGAQAHANLQASGGARQASWHVQVDDTEAIRSYLDTAQCWHGGTSEANRNSLAVEICVNEGGDYDAAFRRAARVVRDWRIKHKLGRDRIRQHHQWTGKDCPRKMRLAARWQEFLNLTDPEGATPTMISPFEGRLTQNHQDSGGYRGHKGMDIAPPKPGQTGKPVYCAFAMYIEEIHRTAKPGNLSSTWAPKRTGNGLLGKNKGPGTSNDGEGNGYNHMLPLASLKVGDFVAAGQLIGYNDKSGNQTAPHLHLEFWADWQNPDSDYDPRQAFDKHKITPGSAPSKTVDAPKAETAPAKPNPSAGYTGNSVVDYLSSVGKDTSLAARKKLATQYGIKNYAGTAAQNTALLAALRGGTSAKATKSVKTMADEVIAGKHGNGHTNRRKSLGISAAEYEKVKAEVNRRAGASPSKTVAQMATEVIAGKHGQGHQTRQKSLGVNSTTYAKVRAEVNRRA